MELVDAIKGRRSIRRFRGGNVEEEVIRRIVDAARWAPSWANSQCAHYILIRDRRRLEALSNTLPERNPARPSFSSCSFCIAVIAEHGRAGYKGGKRIEERDWYMFDTALAAQNICLTAYSEGLGSVIVGLFDHKAANRVLSVPEGYETVCLIPIGYPERIPDAPPRKPMSELLHYETFSSTL